MERLRGRAADERRLARWRPLVGALAIAVAVGGCGIGDRQDNADRIHRSRRLFADAPTTAQVTFALEVDRRALRELEASERERLEAALAGTPGASAPTLVAQATLEGGSRAAHIRFDPAATEPAAVFLDSEVFAKRLNARPTERRTWARLDLADLENRERGIDTRALTPPQVLAAVASTVNPTYFVDMVEGALAGSVRPKGEEVLGDVPTTRYDVNISFDKALTELDLDDEDRLTRMRLFWLIGAGQDVVPAQVWLDDGGQLRRLAIEFKQRVTRQRTNKLNVTVELHNTAPPSAVTPPSQELTVSYERFGRLVRSVLPPAA